MTSAKRADELGVLERYYREEFKDMLLFAARALKTKNWRRLPFKIPEQFWNNFFT